MFIIFRGGLLVMATALSLSAMGQSIPEQSPTASDAVQASCIEVEVGSARSVSYDCLALQLTPPAQPAARSHPDFPNPALASERAVQLPPNQNGLKTSIQININSGVRRDR